MAPEPKLKKALAAMQDIGISEDAVKPVLKKLLKVYDKNWTLIAAENYRVLADAIFEEQEARVTQPTKRKDVEPVGDYYDGASSDDEIDIPLKRRRLRNQGPSRSLSLNNSTTLGNQTLSKQPKAEVDVERTNHRNERTELCLVASGPVSPKPLEVHGRTNTKQPETTNFDLDRHQSKELSPPPSSMTNKKHVSRRLSGTPPAKRPTSDQGMGTDQLPLEVIYPDSSINGDIEVVNLTKQKPNSQQLPTFRHVETEGTNNPNPATSLEIASSPLGEVKISLSCSSTIGGPNFHMPSLDKLREQMDERCLRSYKIIDPNISLVKLMHDMCECFVELATNYSNESLEKIKDTSLDIELSSNSEEKYALVVRDSEMLRPLNDTSDITRQKENVAISWVNEIGTERPPPFNYIQQNQLFNRASVNFTFSLFKDDKCCPTCFDDCLSVPEPCACGIRIGGVFAYNTLGLLKEEFLEEAISMTLDPQIQCFRSCKVCPLQKSKKGETVEPCKGHLKRLFIKECWTKCGCRKQCGNRVVQRGINRKLQVFFTAEGKGWGLRTLEKLPKGAFVCEYIGEVLTITELYERIPVKTTSPVLLDAYWATGRVSEDNKALCLDASYYGNIARYINHRCFDANLIEVPVEVDTPEHHYYHLAFFTTRDIDAMEELTWDYGINFDEFDHPVKRFQCFCGSKFCRNVSRAKKSKYPVNGSGSLQ